MKRITFNVTDEQAAVLKDNHRLYGITQSEQIRRGIAFIFNAARHARDAAQGKDVPPSIKRHRGSYRDLPAGRAPESVMGGQFKSKALLNPSEALTLYQSGKSLREVGAILGGAHVMEVQRVLKRTGCYVPHPRKPKHQLERAEAKLAYWKQVVEELQKA